MLGDDAEDFSEDLSGFPLERMTGVEGVRGSEGEAVLDEALEKDKNGEDGRDEEGEIGDEVGKGTAEGGSRGGMSIRGGGSTEGENLPEFMERRRELIGEYGLEYET